ncbi:MAG: 2-amino-3,7-dideoxy-D-threo-hept-6-ulosonate synthase [Candidatus Bathyarchaeota archaeon BA2]|nr:MAG: 2-amino-3,7-dideoxy-D-threo-hept-6-ulosonate synthase [Candidatus Bathyarchaeota archaeon BA2]
MESGKKKRLKRIFRDDERTVIVPMDHGVTVGPVTGLANMQEIINKLLRGGVDAVVLHRGVAKHVDTGNAGLIVHLSGITKLGPDPNNKVQVCSVEEAVRIGADAVSVHVNVGAEQEDKMLVKLGRVADDCDRYGVPLLAMMYPRGPKIKNQHAVDVVAHAARLGAELGADVIKTNYTGDIESFKEVVNSCYVPVIIAGGPKAETVQEVLHMVHDSIKAGGAGLSVGRNVFQHENPTKMVKALSAIVHNGASVDKALKILGELK